MIPRTIDLNADVGEGMATDAALIPLVSSVNIACGAHAGDAATMRSTVRLALAHGVAIGAHPGFDDREHFGRRELALADDVLHTLVHRQVMALRQIAAEEGGAVTHVKPHGALYNMAARDPRMAHIIATAIREIDPALVLVGLAGSASLTAARDAGLRVAAEAFADRTYRADGSLTARTRPDALHTSDEAAVAQVMTLLTDGTVRSVDGPLVAVQADTICLHGDGPRAIPFARALREALAHGGVQIRPMVHA